MPDHAHLTAFVAAALVLAVTPGPGIFYVLARSLGEGTRVGVRSTLGTGVGGLCHVVGAALGLSTLLMTSAPRSRGSATRAPATSSSWSSARSSACAGRTPRRRAPMAAAPSARES